MNDIVEDSWQVMRAESGRCESGSVMADAKVEVTAMVEQYQYIRKDHDETTTTTTRAQPRSPLT